ncbi:mechanosensitive ion channel family protein [Halomarina oriensis]|uniref:Mechanosensitive ion channel n=1 Tax=Halomarina oriensis TaxID=671145 RepID=A0A6B0GPU6_9EURY|nr:mechanosensitive ion channel family protein [Halomarina oriensis]MWG36051.1 mechanosensitive ion channel [Halomarina oriensis]
MRSQDAPDDSSNATSTTEGTEDATTTATEGGDQPTPRDGAVDQVPTDVPPSNAVSEWLGVDLWVGQLILAILVAAAAWYAANLLTQTFGRRVARRFRRPSVTRTVLRLMRLGVYALAFLSILSIYRVSLGDITISLGVLSAVIGIVLAPIIGSYIQGLFVLADQPYEVGDMIELVGRTPPQRGFVEDITLRYTKIFTLDNTFLVVPNGNMRDRDVINYSAEDPRARLSLDVLVTYEGDIEEAREIIEDAARGVDRVVGGGPDIRIGSARYPAAPTCYIENFADHGVNLRLRYWVREPYKLLTVRSRIQERIWDALDDADVEIAYPHSHLFFDETSGELPVSLRENQRPSRESPRRGDRRAHDGGETGERYEDD